ncbi:GNAT family N-acetyltransferase [Agrococcus pavilionensis]|nr:GNAT family protein [Agrococcus pavilionensis]
MTLEEIWPLLGLRLTTPRLELRPLADDDIPHYVAAAASGIHDHAPRTPFGRPWDEAPDMAARSARWIWQSRVRADRDDWVVMLGVWADGALIGAQDVAARRFPAERTVGTGSWLRRDAQGRGYGTEMRLAALLWAFDSLGAEVAETTAYDWNAASLGVSRALGYQPNGESRHSPREGVVERELNLRLTADALRRPEWTLGIEGGEAAARFLGAR